MHIKILLENELELPNLCRADSYKKQCLNKELVLIATGRNGKWYGSLPFLVCTEHLDAYLKTNRYVKVPVVVDLQQGAVVVED